ncbi:MAG: MFS transporter [Clostridia bacterium]|nr:MFS transporter [Clostridia bacterium]
MDFSYNMATSKQDNSSTVSLTICHCIFAVISLFLSTFLVAYIYDSSDLYLYIFRVALFTLVKYATFIVVYHFSSIFVKRTNRVWFYRLGCLLLASLVIVSIFAGEQLADIIALAGLLIGLAEGVYYAAYNVIRQEMVSRKVIGKVNIIIRLLQQAIEIIFPLVFGTLIDASSFSMVAIYVLILWVAQIVVSMFIKSQKAADTEYRPVKYLKELKQNKELSKKMNLVYMICGLYGFSSIASVMSNICIINQWTGNITWFGAFTSISSAVAILCMLLVSRFTKDGKRSWLFIMIASLSTIVTVVYAIWPSIPTIIVYNVGMAISNIIIISYVEVYRNKNLKEAGYYKYIAEHQTVVETIFCVVRVITAGLLVLIGLAQNITLFYVMLAITTAIYAMTAVLLMVYEKKYVKDEPEKVEESKAEEPKEIEEKQ